MAKYKLAISIPTYERPDCVTGLVDYMIEEAERLNVGIYVFDGSEKDDTENVCKKYEKYNCFNYVRHSGTVAKRHGEAIWKPDCDYLFLTRDRTVLKLEFWPLLLKVLEEQCDVYLLMAFDNPEQDHIKYYTNPKELAFDLIRSMTYFGSFVVKRDFLRNIKETNETYLSNFPLVYKVLDSAAYKSDFKALYLPFGGHKGFCQLFEEIESDHRQGKVFLEVWGKCWACFIENLPNYYNDCKAKLILDRSCDHWSFLHFLTLCRKGTLSPKLLKEYKEYIVKVTKVPWWVMISFAYMPTFIPHTLREIIRPFVRLYRAKKTEKARKSCR